MAKPLDRTARIESIPLGKMHVSDLAQRKRNDSRVDYLVAQFDLDQLGYPVVNKREDRYYVIDGQHRVEALKRWLGAGWEAQQIPVQLYVDMTEAEEAEMFLALNDVLRVGTFEKFKTAVTAGREAETRIYATVQKLGLHISKEETPGAISAVGALRAVYTRSNADTLRRSLAILRDSFGDSGFESAAIKGAGLLCQRYNGQLDEKLAITRLRETRGGIKGLLGRAATLRLRTGNPIDQCVAAAIVDIVNSHRGGKKLPSWWKSENTL